MNFLWNIFTPKEKEQEKQKKDEKKLPDLNSFAFDFDVDKKKEEKKINTNKNQDEDIEPIEEMQKDIMNINKIKIKDKSEKNNKEIIKEEKKEKEVKQAINNNTDSSHQTKKIVKKKKGAKGKITKAENKDDDNTNINKEKQNILLNLEINKEDDSKTLLIQNKSEDSQQIKQMIPEKINKVDSKNKKVILDGPKNSPYENGKFELSINYDNNDLKPILKFITKIYHYNITQIEGEILCPFIWNKNNSENENIKNIQTLLLRPDTRFPCSKFIKDEYYNNYPSYKEKAQKFTENYAMN